MPSSSTLELLQVSISRNVIKFSMFADPSEENCLFTEMDKLKKMKLEFIVPLKCVMCRIAHIYRAKNVIYTPLNVLK